MVRTDPAASALRSLACFLIVCGLLCPPAFAWAPQTRINMTDQAMRLMPKSLRTALEHHRSSVLRGLLEAQLTENSPAHRPSWLGQGRLEESIAEAAAELVASIESAKPFDRIAWQFGKLAHFVSDASFPPGMTRDGGRRFSHFAGFCESRREKFPFVFFGHEDAQLDEGDFDGFAGRIVREAYGEDEVLRRAYDAAGDPPDPAAFDDRSVPFAIGSLSYSRTTTYVVRAWMAAWKRAGGDLSRTPYLGENERGK